MRNPLSAALIVVLAITATPAMAAQSGERSPYDLNPKCRERDAKPEDCVIDDGPPQRRVRPQQPPAKPVTPPPPAPKPQEPILRR